MEKNEALVQYILFLCDVRHKILRNVINVDSQNQEALENKLKTVFFFIFNLAIDAFSFNLVS